MQPPSTSSPAPSPRASGGSTGQRAVDMIALVFERVAESLEQVERALHGQLDSEAPLIAAIGDHVFDSGGKRLRPALLCLAAELCGYTGPRRIQIAAALELIHTATLLHDDVVDLATVRRGKPAAHVVWGNKRSILAGDFLYARASTMIVEDGSAEILRIFTSCIQAMSEGELLQLERSFDVDAPESHYYKVIERKSATLLSAAGECGAVVASVTRAEQRRLAEYGRELGLAFQIRDDALDYEADERALGKHRYTDLREGKVTLPLLLTLKRCTTAEREMVAALLKDVAADALQLGEAERPAEDFAGVLELVHRYRGVEDTIRRAEEHVARATAAIAPYADGPPKQAMLAAAAFAVARDR
ncbi:MAG: polyprenyl synthetase family protein [Myxococcota bacterium]